MGYYHHKFSNFKNLSVTVNQYVMVGKGYIVHRSLEKSVFHLFNAKLLPPIPFIVIPETQFPLISGFSYKHLERPWYQLIVFVYYAAQNH